MTNRDILKLQTGERELLICNANNLDGSFASNHVSTTLHKSGQMRVDLRQSQKTFRCCAVECNCFIAYLALGMVGFVLFWSVLMLRIYLPEKYWRWSYIWD